MRHMPCSLGTSCPASTMRRYSSFTQEPSDSSSSDLPMHVSLHAAADEGRGVLRDGAHTAQTPLLARLGVEQTVDMEGAAFEEFMRCNKGQALPGFQDGVRTGPPSFSQDVKLVRNLARDCRAAGLPSSIFGRDA